MSLGGSAWVSALLRAGIIAENRLFKIGACDWSLHNLGRLSALDVAKEIGLDGVQVSFNRPGEGDDLRRVDVRERYLQKCEALGVEIASLAIIVLNAVPLATSDDAERWLAECIEIMPKLGQKVVLLPFFGPADIAESRELQQQVIVRLKRVAPLAEKAGVILGLETWLSAEDHVRIIDAVGSAAVQVYYDVANSLSRGYDIYREIRWLGRERICEIHCKENKTLLGKGEVDFARVKEALDEIGWSGWLIIEGAIGPGMTLKDSYVANQKFLRSLFPTKS